MKTVNNLKKIRLERGLGQRQLAAAAGTTAATICRYEKGKRLPSLVLAMRIADVLGCKPEDLFAVEGKEAV